MPGTGYLKNDCLVWQGDSKKLKFPPLVYKPCGEGCEVADLVQNYDPKGAYLPVASTHLLSGVPTGFLGAASIVKTGRRGYVAMRVIELANGKTLGSVMFGQASGVKFAVCQWGNGRESALAPIWLGGELRTSVTFDLDSREWLWAQPFKKAAETPQGRIEFDIDHKRARFDLGKGAVWILPEPAKNEWQLLESPSKSYLGSGQGDLAIWVDDVLPGKQSIKGWAPDGKGIRTLLTGLPVQTCMVTVSPTKIVGYATDAGCTSLKGGGIQLFSAPRSLNASTPSVGPVLKTLPFLGRTEVAFKSWGDFAVFHGSIPQSGVGLGERFFLMVRLSDNAEWWIQPEPGMVLNADGWALTDKYFYYTEQQPKTTHFVSQLKRVQLKKLDVAAKRVK